MKTIGVIPARYGSTRFPAKILADLNGKPLIQHVWEGARKAKRLDDLLIATDDVRIKEICEKFGAKAVLTSPSHKSGSDRIAQAVKPLKVDIVVNIQGDEPLVKSTMIDAMVQVLINDKTAMMSTVIKPIENNSDLDDPNVVKVVVDHQGNAIYFSRSPIPYNRQQIDPRSIGYFKHLGLYAYRKNFLMKFLKLPPSKLEQAEQLEQLRVLEAGFKIKTVTTMFETIAVDTQEDLSRVKNYLNKTVTNAQNN